MEYFLNGIARQSEDALGRIKRLQETVKKWKQLFTGKADKNCLLLIDDQFVESLYDCQWRR